MITLIQNINPGKNDELINFLCNFFYENPFNASFDQEELLILIYHLLENEIYNMTSSFVTSFLDSNFIANLLKCISRRQDIKSYLSMILAEIILNMENMSSQFISLELSRIADFQKSNKIKIDSDVLSVGFDSTIAKKKLYCNLRKSSLIKDSNKDISQESSELLLPPEIFDVCTFIKKELKDNKAPDLEYKVELNENEIALRAQKENNIFMQEFYRKILKQISEEKKEFSNCEFIQNLSQYKDNWQSILEIYKQNFEKIKFFIDKLILNLLNNEAIIPYTIKCISRIINILLSKKYPKLSTVERNAFISEFIFGKLIFPILTNPDYNGILSSSIISINTRKNLLYLTKILKKIFRHNLFESKLETNYTLFNTYFCEIMPKVNVFISKLINVKLPNAIEQLLKQTKNIKNVQKEEDYFLHKSICFTFNDLFLLYNTMKDNIIKFENLPSFDKIQNLYELMVENENNILFERNSNQNIKYYFVISDNVYKSKIIDLINNKEKYTLGTEAIQVEASKMSEEQRFIIDRLKFCIGTILSNLNSLKSEVNSYLNSSKSTDEFLTNLSKIIKLEDYSDRIINDKIPLGWYFLYLESNISKLSVDYSANDYKKLYSELMQDTNQFIFSLQKNDYICKLEMKISISEKINELLNKDLVRTKQIEKFIRMRMFIENTKLLINIKIDHQMSPTVIITKTDKKNFISCETIHDFIEKFQLLSEVRDDVRLSNHFNKVNQSFADYISLIKQNVEKDFLFTEIKNEEEMSNLLEGIENFIIEQMYPSIYPCIQSKNDLNFYQKCLQLKWITPDHLSIRKMFINEKLWSIAICYINRIDLEKTPINKLKCVHSAYKILNNCINFCTGKVNGGGVDDILPIFIYVIIKSFPKRIYSNLYFIQALMSPNKLMNTYGFLYSQIEMATQFITNLTGKDLNLSEEEFNKLIRQYN